MSDFETKVKFKTGHVHDFRVSGEGKAIIRLQDGKVWHRKK